MTFRPTPAQLAAAKNRTIHDVISPGLKVLFVGINPSLYSAAVGHHFARPGNRFWPALHGAGFTPRLLDPFEDEQLLQWQLGVTNLVARATATAAELTSADYRAGAVQLQAKVQQYQPAWVAFVGIGAYGHARDLKGVQVGPQEGRWAGGRVWVLPNPSGLNAHYQLPQLITLFRELREAMDGP